MGDLKITDNSNGELIIKFIRNGWNLLQISGLIPLLFVVGIFGTLYTLFLRRVAGFPAFAFGVSLSAKFMLTLLLIVSLLAIGFIFILAKSWLKGEIKKYDKIFYLLVTISFMGTIHWLNYWNLLGYRY